jgi:hypothetical protein
MKPIPEKMLKRAMAVMAVSLLLANSVAFADDDDDDDDEWRGYGRQPYGWYQSQPAYVPTQPVYAVPQQPVYVSPPPVTYGQPQPPLVVEAPGLPMEMPVGNGYYRQW